MSKQISFDINCKSGLLSPNGNNSVTITIEDCDKDDLIEIVKDLVSVSDIVSSLDSEEVLDSIGIDEVKKHFNLTDTE